ncbi:hypothetical protein D499_0B00270 [Hanseniaspora uvarum DSM 2768]|nr:hypothetical protein D499_0B00270 [Hanseniaspora uvarum DSM 2768]
MIMVHSNSTNLANSQKQQNLQQQYKQNIVQFNSSTNNKLQTIKSTDRHLSKTAEALEKPKKSKKNMNKKTAIVNTGANHGVPTRARKAMKQNFNNKGKLAPAKDEIETTESNNDNKLDNQVDDNKRRRSSAAMWNLKEKAAMPYGNFDTTTNGNQTAIDDEEENLLQLGFMNPNLQQNTQVHQQTQNQPQNWQPSIQQHAVTPVQNGFTNINQNTKMMNPMMNHGMPNMMPMGMHNGSHGFVIPGQHYQQPLNPLQHQSHLGLPNMLPIQHNLPTPNMMPNKNMYNPMNTLGNPHYHTNNMINNNHMMIREQHSPIIPALPLNTSAIPTSYSDNYSNNGNSNSRNQLNGMNKKKQSQSTGQLTNEGTEKQERYAGTSFGVSAPMLKSFPKPSF